MQLCRYFLPTKLAERDLGGDSIPVDTRQGRDDFGGGHRSLLDIAALNPGASLFCAWSGASGLVDPMVVGSCLEPASGLHV